MGFGHTHQDWNDSINLVETICNPRGRPNDYDRTISSKNYSNRLKVLTIVKFREKILFNSFINLFSVLYQFIPNTLWE